jgi:hypothetical protein
MSVTAATTCADCGAPATASRCLDCSIAVANTLGPVAPPPPSPSQKARAIRDEMQAAYDHALSEVEEVKHR